MGTLFFQRQVSLASLVIALVASSNSSAAKTSRSLRAAARHYRSHRCGHGGHDRGGIPGQSVAEKEMTLDVAQRLRNVCQLAVIAS